MIANVSFGLRSSSVKAKKKKGKKHHKKKKKKDKKEKKDQKNKPSILSLSWRGAFALVGAILFSHCLGWPWMG